MVETKAIHLFFLAGLSVLFLHGCASREEHRSEAEKEAYEIIREKTPEVEDMHGDFSIEPEELDLEEKLPEAPAEIIMEEEKEGFERETGENALLLDLEGALRIGALKSREYQREKEAVFFQALELSSERNRLAPQFFWDLRGETGYDTEQHWSAETSSAPGAEWLLSTGAQLSAELSASAVRFLSGDPRTATSSVFDLTLTQPLLRGGRMSTLEPLTQTERDMVYQLRDFVRYQRDFSVGILSDYYRVLERRRRVQNERVNYENLTRIRERAEALGEAGRVPEMQIDRARQDELSARDNLDDALQSYRRALDDFKRKLGIKPEKRIVAEPADMEALEEFDIEEPPIEREKSLEVALQNRLDLVTSRQEVEDAGRKVEVAAEALEPGLNLVLGATGDTPGNQPLNFAGGTRNTYAALDAELPLERTDERNRYMQTIIEHQRANRNFEDKRDEVVLEVINGWRDFERAVSGYETQRRSVDLARERVESTELLFEAGRATTRDVLDAHEDLLRAQNRLAARLVDFKIASLELERDMDILVITEDGTLEGGAGYNGTNAEPN